MSRLLRTVLSFEMLPPFDLCRLRSWISERAGAVSGLAGKRCRFCDLIDPEQ